MKVLDNNEVKKEGNALAIGVEYKSKIFKEGKFVPDENSSDSIDYKAPEGKQMENPIN